MEVNLDMLDQLEVLYSKVNAISLTNGLSGRLGNWVKRVILGMSGKKVDSGLQKRSMDVIGWDFVVYNMYIPVFEPLFYPPIPPIS